MKKSFYGTAFKIARFFIRPFYPKYECPQKEKAITPAVYISHHQNMYGPVMSMLWFPKPIHIWWLHVFKEKDTCYKHFLKYTFTERYGWTKRKAKLIAFPFSRMVSLIFHSCKAIPVYRNSRRINETFELSVNALMNGEPVLIFPDVDYQSDSSEMGEMYKGFLHLERYYYEKTGKHIPFIPFHIDKQTQQLIIDDPICFKDGISYKEDSKRVYDELLYRVNYLSNIKSDDV